MGKTKFDFVVDEGKGRLNPSHVKNYGKHRRRKVEKSCVTPASPSTSVTSRINGMTTYTTQPKYGKGQADAGWDCRNRLARLNSQARTGTGKCYFSLFSCTRAGLVITLSG